MPCLYASTTPLSDPFVTEQQQTVMKLDQVNNANSVVIFLINLWSIRVSRVVWLVRVGQGGQGDLQGLSSPCGPVGQVSRLVKVVKVVKVVQVVLVVKVVKVVQVVKVVSLDYMHSENIWFTWSKPSDYWEELRCHLSRVWHSDIRFYHPQPPLICPVG